MDDVMKKLTDMFGPEGASPEMVEKIGEKNIRRAKAFIVAADLLTNGGKNVGDDLDSIEKDSPSLNDAVAIAFSYGLLSCTARLGAANMRGGADALQRELQQLELMLLVSTMMAEAERRKRSD